MCSYFYEFQNLLALCVEVKFILFYFIYLLLFALNLDSLCYLVLLFLCFFPRYRILLDLSLGVKPSLLFVSILGAPYFLFKVKLFTNCLRTSLFWFFLYYNKMKFLVLFIPMLDSLLIIINVDFIFSWSLLFGYASYVIFVICLINLITHLLVLITYVLS